MVVVGRGVVNLTTCIVLTLSIQTDRSMQIV